METATAAVGSLLPKLQAYLLNHHKEDRCGDAELLSQELTAINATLRHHAQAQPGRRDEAEDARAWARQARELAYDADDAIDALLVTPPQPARAENGGDRAHTPPGNPSILQGLAQRATELSRTAPLTAGADAAPAAVDRPRRQQPPPPDKAAVLVGVDDARDGLIRRLRLRPRGEAGDADGAACGLQAVRVVSVVGPAGMGKTALAMAAYGVLESQFDCAAFVSVGLDPDIGGVLETLIRQLGFTGDTDGTDQPRGEQQLVSQLRGFLQDKRYLIVLDDLWDKPSWDKIRCALIDNSLGSRIVLTARNLDVADQVGTSYVLKPLSEENSKILFFRTIFGHDDMNSPDDEFTEVADKILKECGGMPLAVVTLAKLLARKIGDKRAWDKLCMSIGSGLESTPEVDSMRMALYPGYYNLPPHLRACLLYLSIFPEDYEIRRDRLIWRWIAEGFVHSRDEQVESLFELGESYFDELINRGMIQRLDIDYTDDGGRYEDACSVSLPVTDLISYLSREENLVAVIDDEQLVCPSAVPVRRVSIRGGSKAEDPASVANTSISQLRSLSVFSPATAEIIDLNKTNFLRVLDLEGCDLSESVLLQNHLGRLIHLRYLGLRETRITCVPEETGNLRCLQTLDLEGNKIAELPATVTRLRELLCLRVDWQTRLPSGINNLTSLEELADASTMDSPDLVKEIGSLTKLRVLRITLWKPFPGVQEALVESLRGLRGLQTLDVYVTGCSGHDADSLGAAADVLREAWAPPRCLQEFRATGMNSYRSPLRQLPAWVGAPTAPCLAVLVVQVMELRQRDFDALGRLPALRVLRLEPYATKEPIVVSGGGAFPRLEECRLRDMDIAPVFRPGAMPRLRRLEFCFGVRNTIDLGNGDFEFGLENLESLEEATIYVACQESREEEAEAAETALQRAADSHPNRATLDVITFGEELMCFDDN